jgi:predicted NACHT family NTPase
MARRSLVASPKGIETLKTTLKRKKWSQTFLAGKADCSRQTIWSLFHGNPIDAEVFLEICTQLGLSEYEIADASQAEKEAGVVLEIDELVLQVRGQIKPWIQERYGYMNVLSMTRPIGLGDIYTDVNILEKITGHKRLALKELEANCLEEDFDRFGFSDLRKVERVPGLDAVDRCKKMVVLGKPGAGKTTFLKRVVTQCNLGTFHPSLVPVFVPLKQFAESKEHPELFAYIANQLAEYRVKDAESKAKNLLYEGRALVLLDGLDEVEKADSSRVIEDIRRFSEQFYKNFYVLTCRIATQEFKLEQFTEVEIADFDDQQIAVFVTKWFELKNPERTESFLRKLNDNPRIRELATNPLLLTLLCLGFEEAGYFSDSRAGLYKEGLNVLLKSWDAKRGIERDVVYRELMPDRKEDLLSQLAYETFEKGQYFFDEEIAKEHIIRYIANLPNANTNTEQLYIDSEAVLKSIEGQHGLLIRRAHGIYSFSHLTFQEYFTARKIAASCNAYSSEDKTLQSLVQRVTEKRWREVFLLMAEILPSADCLLQLMKQKIDTLLTQEDTFQKFLEWVQQKSNTVDVPYKSAAVRAYYFSLAFALACTRDGPFSLPYAVVSAIEPDAYLYSYGNLTLDYKLAIILAGTQTLETDHTNRIVIIHTPDGSYTPKSDPAGDLSFALELVLHFDKDSELNQQLQQLRAVVLENSKQFKSWWKAQGQAWATVLRATMIEFLNIGHDWKFTSNQIALLQQYLDSNLLLVNCLNSNCYVSRSVRQEIEDTLLLPIAEIEKRKSVKSE